MPKKKSFHSKNKDCGKAENHRQNVRRVGLAKRGKKEKKAIEPESSGQKTYENFLRRDKRKPEGYKYDGPETQNSLPESVTRRSGQDFFEDYFVA